MSNEQSESNETAASKALPSSVGYIFEVKDASSDEMYYTCGLYLTFEEALRESIGDAPHIETDEDCAKIEINKRKIGEWNWSGTGETVATVEWHRNDDWGWETPKVTSSYNAEDRHGVKAKP